MLTLPAFRAPGLARGVGGAAARQTKTQTSGPTPVEQSGIRAAGIPLCLRRLGLRCSDETEVIGDQRRELLAAIAKVAEETIDRRLKASEGRVVLIPQRGLLEKPPQPLDQVEIRRIGRQKDQLDVATLAGQIFL